MSKITKIWIDEWHNNEYYSKRNLRPKQTPGSSLRDQVEAAKIEIHRMNPLRNHKKIGKRTRYFLRSVYGSKY